MYSAAMLDFATVGCMFDFQECNVPFPKLAHAVSNLVPRSIV